MNRLKFKKAMMIAMAAAIMGTSSQMPQIAGNMTQVCAQELKSFDEVVNGAYKDQIQVEGDYAYKAYTGWFDDELSEEDYDDMKANGVTIMAYKGTEQNVVVPATLGGKKVVAVEKGVFAGNDNIVSVQFSEGVKQIAFKTIYNCKNIEKISLPQTLVQIGETMIDDFTEDNSAPFMKCPKLTEIVTENNAFLFEDQSLIRVDRRFLFRNCDVNATKAVVPEGVREIKPEAYRDHKMLENINLNNGTVEYIFENAFTNCTNLKKVTIPESVRYIAKSAFGTNLKTIRGYRYGAGWKYAKTKKLNFEEIKLKAPASLKVKRSSSKKIAKISWKANKNATGYEIYRADKKNGTYKKIKTIKKAATVSYTDKKLNKTKNYYYKVRAVKKMYGGTNSIKKIDSYKNLFSKYSSVKKA